MINLPEVGQSSSVLLLICQKLLKRVRNLEEDHCRDRFEKERCCGSLRNRALEDFRAHITSQSAQSLSLCVSMCVTGLFRSLQILQDYCGRFRNPANDSYLLSFFGPRAFAFREPPGLASPEKETSQKTEAETPALPSFQRYFKAPNTTCQLGFRCSKNQPPALSVRTRSGIRANGRPQAACSQGPKIIVLGFRIELGPQRGGSTNRGIFV